MTITPWRPTPSTRSSTWSRPSRPSAAARHDDARRRACGGRGRARRGRAGVGIEPPSRPRGRPGRRRPRSSSGTRRTPRLGLRAVGRGRRRRLGPLGAALVDAALAQLPAGIDRVEMAGDVARARMAALRGAQPAAGEVSHVYAASATAAAGWPTRCWRSGRPPPPTGRPSVRCTTRSSPRRTPGSNACCPTSPTGSSTCCWRGGLAAPRVRRGRVQADGDGYLDFLAVPDAARGRGVGKDLLVAIGRYLVDRRPHHDVNLTVQDHRTPPAASTSPSASELQLDGRYRPPKSR